MNAESIRLFFALWPDAAVRDRLNAASGKLHERRGGRRTRPETLHLTLVFIGEIALQRLPEVFAAAEGVTVEKFELLFDHADCWRHNHIAHLGVGYTPPALLELVGQLESRLAASEIPFDRRPYVPHITLLRKADCAALIEKPVLQPIRWPARDFVLVSSRSRAWETRYEQRGRWPLL